MRKSVPLLLAVIILASLLSACSGGSGPIYPPDGNNDGRPADYELLYSDRICRWDSSAFPLGVFIDPPPASAGAYGPIMLSAARDAVNTWDGVIDGIPDVFNLESESGNEEITVRWQECEGGGYTRVTDYGYYIAIHKIALSEDLRDPELIRLFMGHELGHVLGLGHSQVSWDLMFSPIDSSKTSLSARDREMASWLYTQQSYVPIRPY